MSPETLQELGRPRSARWLLLVAADWLMIVGAFAAASAILGWDHPLRPPALLAVVLVVGARQHALGLLGHEGVHRLVARHRGVNDGLARVLCLWPLGFALSGYRRFHLGHHRDVGTPGDPERIHTTSPWLEQWRLPLRPRVVACQVLGDFFGGSFPHLGTAAFLTRSIGWCDRLGTAAMAGGLLLACARLGCLWVPALWFGSLVTSFWVAFRLRIWTEHTVEDGAGDPTHRIAAAGWQRFFFLPHNTWCHWEYHHYPQVPAQNLPRVRQLTLEEGPPILTVGELVRSLRAGRRPLDRDPSRTPANVMGPMAGLSRWIARSGGPKRSAGS